ncbi:uncharacterized protein KY384_001136 [Bacidia gigantensis]|uniref:uncharacterized protein n=1 Tax=Bacidia gigantensis TaxID=2732470 RepID=UPI001D04C18D|nr:uncharacterized protein KY384_001136 [Bacidia gigantensis]KAG8534292.1 hypothetical protein KY384_001136 [Bacidia gigantensis]
MADYNKLATLMATHQDMAIFRAFSSLNVQNILCLQAELTHLEAELADIAIANKTSGDREKMAFQYSFFDLKGSGNTNNDLQWRKVVEIRGVLEAYSYLFPEDTALLQFAQLQQLSKPTTSNLSVLKEWLERPEGGDFFLRGREAEMWDNGRDTITTSSLRAEHDSLTKLIINRPKMRNGEEWNGLWYYDDAVIVTIANITSIALSSILPALSVLALYVAGSRAELDITICCGSQESAKTTPAIADKSLSVSMISKSLVQYLRCKVKNCQKREERDHKGNPRVLEQYVELSWHKAGEAAMVFPEKFYILDYCQPLVILGKTAHSGNSSGSEIGVIAMKPQADDEDEKQEQDRKRKEAQERNAKEKEIQKSKEKEKQQQSKKG